MDLRHKKCVPCEGGSPLTPEQEDTYMTHISDWELDRTRSASSGQAGTHKLIRKYKFADFVEAMQFVNDVAKIANAEDHHPNITINYSRITLELFTHAVGGLSENDFIMAAKINELKK